ncbi:hypothetical protein Tco_0601117 [Tanacetum coccineum]
MVSLTITFYHKEVFVGPLLEYLEGYKNTIKDLDFGNFTYGKFFKCIKAATLFPLVGLFYCLPESNLSDGIIELKNEQHLVDLVATTLGNGGHIDVYVEHHGYDIHDWFAKDNDDLENYDEDGIPWKDMVPILGLKFKDHEEMKMMLANYGVANGYQLWYKRNDYKSLLVLCGRNVKEGRCASKVGRKGKSKEKVAEGKGKEKVAEGKGKEGKGKEKVAEGSKVAKGSKVAEGNKK